MLPWAQPVAFVNARVADGRRASRRRCGSVRGSCQSATPPRRGDMVVDLDGAFVLPGLINAHDHLELNHYGRLKRRDRYDNATAWIDDLRPALRRRSGDSRRTAPTRWRHACSSARLKNLLAGRDDRRASQPALSRDRPELPGPRPAPLRVGAFVRARTAAGRRTRRTGRRRPRAVPRRRRQTCRSSSTRPKASTRPRPRSSPGSKSSAACGRTP